MDYTDICEKIVGEMTDRSLSELRENPEIKAILLQQADSLDKLLSTLPDDCKSAVTAYIEKQNELSLCQLRLAYQCGALDCVKLLKKLGVI